MNKGINLVNIGTKEAPVFVPEKALKPETAEGREWWGMMASGSVKPDNLDLLIKCLNEQKAAKG